MALMADIFNKTLVLADGTVLDCFDPDLLNLKDGSGCGTGAGGFKPGNTCARGGAGVEEVDLHPALKKLKVPQDRINEMEDHVKYVVGKILSNGADKVDDALIAEHTQYLNEKLKGIVAKAKPHIRVSDDAMSQILDDGRFKNQFEVARSGGAYNPRLRAKVENVDMGVDPETPHPERPIYGYLTEDALNFGTSSLESYGAVVIELHSEVKDRSTITLQDSLQRAVATPANNPSLLSMAEDAFGTPPQLKRDTVDIWPYTEMQVHGGLSLKDIKKVNLQSPGPRRPIIDDRNAWRQAEWDKFDQQREVLIKKLEAAGIAWELY